MRKDELSLLTGSQYREEMNYAVTYYFKIKHLLAASYLSESVTAKSDSFIQSFNRLEIFFYDFISLVYLYYPYAYKPK